MEYCKWSDSYSFEMSDMVGKVFDSVVGKAGGDKLVFENTDGRFTFYHEQDCCESVYIESIVGDLSDLVGEEILGAEEVTSTGTVDDEYESVTWTFYKFRTRKGYVDVRWCGSSNGYYSESVDMKFEKA